MSKHNHTFRTDALAKSERHLTVAETRYWCNQYKQLARTLERENAELLEALTIAEKCLIKCKWVGTEREVISAALAKARGES